MDEFAFIARCLAPLADDPGAFGLLDDAALTPAAPEGFVVTADALSEGVHFLPDDPLDTVARKLVRANLSDLIAKGAAPAGGVLTLAWPRGRPLAQAADFAAGLAAERANGFRLFGGDTIATDGPLTVSLTLFGRALGPAPVLRRTARAGDLVLVSGVIGDGWLGLQARLGRLAGTRRQDAAALARAYQIPEPPFGLAAAVAAHASAALDVSDGLVIDAGRIAAQSGVTLAIAADDVPLSPPARRWLAAQPDADGALAALLTGGDDYQTLLTVAPARLDAFLAAAGAVTVAVIGRCAAGQGGVAVTRADGRPLRVAHDGWRHFAS